MDRYESGNSLRQKKKCKQLCFENQEGADEGDGVSVREDESLSQSDKQAAEVRRRPSRSPRAPSPRPLARDEDEHSADGDEAVFE